MPIDRPTLKSRLRRVARALLRPGASLPSYTSRMLHLHDIGTLHRAALEDACRRDASPVYLGDHIGLCRILGRYKFHVDTRDSGFGANILLDGYWELWLTQFMARSVARGAVVVDVGANYGYYSLLLGDLVGPAGHVYAIEPNPAAAALLRRSVALNGFAGRTTICEVAAGATDGGTATLFVPHGEPKNAAIVPDAALLPDGAAHDVPVTTLDSLLIAHPRIDFIKIDAEGAEQGIVAGLARTFQVHRPDMVLEFNAARYADPAGFLGELTALYGPLRHVDFAGNAVAITTERVLTEQFGEDWLLFLSAS
jgi:FkbM family methyltransferase